MLAEVSNFIKNYDKIMDNPDKTDLELSTLETDGAKIPIFFREIFVVSKKNSYISIWKELADSVLKSVPVLNMELKARKPE